MNALLLFLRRTLIVFLVGTFISVSTFRGEAVAQEVDIVPFNACTLQRTDNTVEQPDFHNPTFAYADTIYSDPDSQQIEEYPTITFDAVQDTFYLDGDGSASAGTGYNGYLYKTTFFDKNNNQKTIVRSPKKPGKIEVVDYDPNNPPDNMVGTYTPPTIVVSPSDREGNRPNSIHLNLTNDLPVNVQLAGSLPQTKENLENQSQYTNIHYHGFNVSPLLGADDVLVDVPSNVTPLERYTTTSGSTIPPGGYYPDDTPDNPKYGGPISEYKMDVKIPYVHQSGLFWYHSHAHSLSDNQVRGGLSGGIIIKGSDKYYEILSPNPTKGIHAYNNAPTIPEEPEQFSVRQKVMMFKDFNNVLDKGVETLCFTVNGQVNPKITIQPGEVQLWRMGNVGADQYMNIALEETDMTNPAFAEPNNKLNFYILSRDADFVEQVVPTNSVLLPPASRVDVLVVGGNTAQGNSTYNLVSDLTTNLTTEDQKWVAPAGQKKSYLLATVNVEGDDVCYADYNNALFSIIGDTGISCVGTEDLYDYIQAQVPRSQTGEDGNPNVDKILPNPEELFDIYDTSGNLTDSIPDCQNRNKDFVTTSEHGGRGCITPANLYSDPLSNKRYFYFSQNKDTPQKFFLKGFNPEEIPNIQDNEGKDAPPTLQELYDGNRIDKISRIGDLEEWHLVNPTKAAHVFHIHQLDFVATDVILDQKLCEPGDENCTYNNYTVGTFTGKGNTPSFNGCTEYSDAAIGGKPKYKCPLLPQGYRDVINLPANSETIVRIPFVNPFITGPFVYHCHILAHEDSGMMNNLKVVNTKGYGGKDVLPQLAAISLR